MDESTLRRLVAEKKEELEMEIPLRRLENRIEKNHQKMMEGFRAIEKAFHVLAGQIVALADDLGSACGIIQSDPFNFENN